ncbi:MarR family winged helix-turn-helix transcriptional regulator [Microbacterium sp. 2MCAF23]|uniref:MarR family winged helix-turn-helix transcriptional regulator n=1 Tax=Microbacterium sp. 2MCAF23 TaxID=3232985 RepID=UPI003F995C82
MTRNPQSADRISAIERVHTALTTIARRGSARVRRDTPLSSVDQSLLRLLADHPGTRAVDIADHFGFNRSTVSRQIGALSAAGLIEETSDDAGESRRGQPLRLSSAGESLLAERASEIRAVTAARMRDWTAEEVAVFAALLERYNGGPEE